MVKALQVALLVAVLALALSSVAHAEEWHIACDLNTPPQPEVFSSLRDEVRWKYVEECPNDIPAAPEGQKYAEDWTLIANPEEYWS